MDDSTEVARWTHLWFTAAVLTLESIEAHHSEDDFNWIGKRDALSLVLLDAVRNTARGARVVLGNGHAALARFDSSAPKLKNFRDRLEHFDEYATGSGQRQKAKDIGVKGALRFVGSVGGGREGHVIHVVTIENGKEAAWTLKTRKVVEAARDLVQVVITSAGLDDERHSGACSSCHPSAAKPAT